MQEEIHLGRTDRKYVILCDNATIHKAKQVRNYSESSKILMVTIPPYSPTLNAAEKIILAIKEKIKRYEDEEGKSGVQNIFVL